MRISTDGGATWGDVEEVKVQVPLYRDGPVTLDFAFDEQVLGVSLLSDCGDTIDAIAEEYHEVVDRVIA